MATIHVVRSGECLSKIAFKYGFADHQVLYDHPDNAELKRQRPNPNLLFPGDRVVIPERAQKTVAHLATSNQHTFRVETPAKVLRLVLRDSAGVPLRNASYVLEVDDNRLQGTTDGEGRLEQPLSVRASVARLELADRTLVLRLGHLNPFNASDSGISGAQSRLANLGYPVDPVDGVAGKQTRTAVAIFQHDQGLAITGKLDAETIRRLEAAHGC